MRVEQRKTNAFNFIHSLDIDRSRGIFSDTCAKKAFKELPSLASAIFIFIGGAAAAFGRELAV